MVVGIGMEMPSIQGWSGMRMHMLAGLYRYLPTILYVSADAVSQKKSRTGQYSITLSAASTGHWTWTSPR